MEHFNEEGISVAMIDNQGSGRSEAARGLRFYVENFDDYVDDVLDLHECVRLLRFAGWHPHACPGRREGCSHAFSASEGPACPACR